MKRRFVVELSLFVEVRIEPSLLDSVLTDEWRSQFYKFASAEEVAEHLAFNLLRGNSLHQLDGFADQPDDAVELDLDDAESVHTEEILDDDDSE